MAKVPRRRTAGPRSGPSASSSAQQPNDEQRPAKDAPLDAVKTFGLIQLLCHQQLFILQQFAQPLPGKNATSALHGSQVICPAIGPPRRSWSSVTRCLAESLAPHGTTWLICPSTTWPCLSTAQDARGEGCSDSNNRSGAGGRAAKAQTCDVGSYSRRLGWLGDKNGQTGHPRGK